MKKRSPITTHVLDTARGGAATNIDAQLEFLDGKSWTKKGQGTTDDNGRIETLLTPEESIKPGTYRLTFDTQTYFQATKASGFYPSVTIVFEIKNPGEHYHVPLLLSPFGYSTYRGT